MSKATVKLMGDSLAFIGDASPGFSLHCKGCNRQLMSRVGDRQVLGLAILCSCGVETPVQQRQRGEPIPTRCVLIPGGNYNISGAVDLRGKPVATVSEDALADYRAEVGYQRSARGPSNNLDETFLEAIAREGTQLLGEEQYRQQLASVSRSRASATPSKSNHRLVELVEYAREAADGLRSANSAPITLDGNLLSELVSLVGLFDRWKGHPGLGNLRKTLANSTDVQHALAQLAVASYLADNNNGVGIVYGSWPTGRIPDLYVRPTYAERLDVEVKTPMALRGPANRIDQAELLRIVEHQVDKAASTKRGQLDPKESGVLALGAFHLPQAFIGDAERAVAAVLHKQQTRKPHLLAVVVGVMSYQEETVVDEQGRAISKSFWPTMEFRVVRHPGYKGELTLSG